MTCAHAVSSVGTEASERSRLTTAAFLRRKMLREPWWGQREERAQGCVLVSAARSRCRSLSHCRVERPIGAMDQDRMVEHSCSSERKTGLCASGRRALALRRRARAPAWGRYLVDSASSHMLVSKIKPCMSKYKQLYCETANGSLNQLSFI